MIEMMTIESARKLSLYAQGFGQNTISSPIKLLNHLGVIQLDSVNIVSKNHELVPFSRLGPYHVDELYQEIYQNGKGFEYWGHSASWIPVSEFPFFKHRMDAMVESGRGATTVNATVRVKHADLYKIVMQRIREEGPLGAADFEDPRGVRGFWWDWKPAKLVLEDLFDQGMLSCRGRGKGFKRMYDLTERVIPDHAKLPDPGLLESARHLMKRAIQAMGVSTAREAADYFRCYRWPAPWKEALEDLVASGEVVKVKVERWRETAYAIPQMIEEIPDTLRHRPCLLAPLDNLLWDRKRVKRLFHFQYKLEFYIPKTKREFGYFVMPLLAENGLHGRADLKFDRKLNELVVIGIWIDRGYVPDAVIALCDLCKHLGAMSIHIEACEADVKPGVLEELASARLTSLGGDEAGQI